MMFMLNNIKHLPTKRYLELVGRTLKHFDKLFILFFIFSVAGHVLELFWSRVLYYTVDSIWVPQLDDLIPLAAPYGLGALFLVIFLAPLMKIRKVHFMVVFLISSFLSTLAELISGVIVLIIYGGKNPFWDYSNYFMNFYGQICLLNAALFGIASMIFIYGIWPPYRRFINHLKPRWRRALFWILFTAFIINGVLRLRVLLETGM